MIVFCALAALVPAVLAEPQQPAPYSLQYWVMGTITKDPGEPNCPDPAGYQAVLYNKDPQGNLYGYAYGVVDAGGKYAINPYDDLRLDPKPLAPYFIGIIAKNGYGAQEIQISLNEQGYTTQDLVLKKGQGAADPAGGTVKVTVVHSDTNALIDKANVVIEGTGLYTSLFENDVYTIKNVPAGGYVVTVTAYPYIPNSAQVTVAGGKNTPATVKLASIPTGKGIFYGYVTDNKGNNLIGVKIEAGVLSTQTDTYGFYTLEAPKGIAYTLTASLNGYNSAAVNKQILNEGAALQVNFELTLKDGSKPGTFAGNVKDKVSENPIAGALISDGTRSKLTDAGGNYTIAGVPVGVYTVTAAAEGFIPGVKSGQSITDNTVTVADFELDPLSAGSAAVGGTVRDAGGNPLAGAVVGTAGITFTTGNDGVYALVIENAETKTYTVQASKDPDYASQAKEVPLAAGESKIVDFVLENAPAPAGTVSLLITRTDGSPDLKLSWTADAAPDIYYLAGDGTGKFSNAFAGWAKLDLTQPSPDLKIFEYHLDQKYILHKNQSGTGEKEVYYKGLVAGNAPTDFLSSAKAVGKLNIELGQDYNLITVPFIYSAGESIPDKVFGAQLNAGNVDTADRIYLKNNSLAWGMPNAYLNTTDKKWHWSNTDALCDMQIEPVRSYLILRKGNNVTITVCGKVPLAEQTLTLTKDFNAIGMVYPVKVGLGALGIFGLEGVTAGNVDTADRIFVKSDSASWGMPNAYLGADGKWYWSNTLTEAADFYFTLPKGYYYQMKGTGQIVWIRNLP